MKPAPLTQADAALIALLARMDAVFSPLRDFDASVAFQEARTAFLSHGLPIHGGGRDRMRLSRQLDALAAQGFVTMIRPKGSRWPCVRLSDAAEERARALCCLPPIAAGWASLERIRGLAEQAGREWVPEHLLCGWAQPRGAASGSAEMAELVLVQQLAAPGLCRGWIDSRSTTIRHVCYSVLPAGLEALEAGEPSDFNQDGMYHPKAWTAYLRNFNAQRAAIVASDPLDQQDIGPIPLSPDSLLWPALRYAPC